MSRVPLNVLVYLYRATSAGYEFALFCRRDTGWWQGVSGGGEDDETATAVAIRETFEEAGLVVAANDLIRLDATEPVPASVYAAATSWGDSVFVVPQIGFGCSVGDGKIVLSAEHSEVRWLDYGAAVEMVRYNHVPLWELNARLLGRGALGAPPPP